MSRIPFTPSIIFLAGAFVLLIIVSISLPTFSAMDFVRIHVDNTLQLDGAIDEARLGIWSFCEYDATNGHRVCSPRHHGYSLLFFSATGDTVTVGSSWTRGLAIHPVAAALAFLALVASFLQHATMPLIAILLTFLASFLTFIAFVVDIALYAFVKSKLDNLNGAKANTTTGPAFWLTFVSFILLCVGGCTVCFGRRRAGSGDTDSYPMAFTSIFKRFRR